MTVTKVVVNDDGGTKQVSDFPLFVGGTPVTSGVETKFLAGTYTISETGSSGYTASFSGDCAPNGSITLNPQDVKSCTITNNDQPAHLIIIKNVTNDNGGSKVASAFSGTITGVSASGGNSWTGTASPGVDKTLTSVGSYSVTETADPDYDTTYSAGCSGTIALGETKIIIKDVINDNGGTKAASAFSGTISGVSAAGGNTWTGAASPGVDKTLTSVGSYNVTETADADYDTTYSADCTGAIALGQTKTCTVTNNDKAAHLIIIKNVINDNGATKAAGAFSGTISGVSAAGGNSWTGTASPGVDKTLTSVGSYNVTETADPLYDTTYSAGCSGAIALGQTKACTVTNDDRPARLFIIKNVINDNGGTKAPGAFSGTISGVSAVE
ncbi:MAG: hypothetical protein DMG13_33405, partial [Acidobacteria bacterium]